ncbi:kinase-like domain-containing protein [Paraphysoderma sedebokerense]|nr:kinase-like domain-containing protein [Paraphysoderma sedebokerense]KAI9144413.1 kinase-like domain-containing protein [Paraphysoderma sedebokerense]
MSKKSPKKIAEETNPDFQLPGIGNYVFAKTVGEGNFAKVKLAKHKLTGQEVAVKIIDKTQLDDKKLAKLYREVRIMKLLHHPHIVRLYEVIETKSTVFLVMEYSSGGELYDYLVVHGRMKEKEARAKFRQILSAVSYCHKKKVIHRDLKAENLLLDQNLDIKIADFGFSNHYDPEGKLDTFCGSPPYAAPELFQGRRYTGPEVDVWSLGVILYVLTTGCLPFDGKNLQEMRESVCRGKYRIPFYLSDSCEKLLRKFLVRDPTKRGSLEMLIDDPWINEGYADSPICTDISLHIDEDESLIKLIEQKFHIDRETILKSLRESQYDDIAALYHLMFHERDKTGDYSRVNQVLNSVTQPISPSSPTAISTLTRNSPTQVPQMTPIAEDGVPVSGAVTSSQGMSIISSTVTATSPQSQNGTSGAPNNRSMGRNTSAARRRRFTVGGEADVQKYADDPEGKDASEALKRLQNAVKEEGDVQPKSTDKERNPNSTTTQEEPALMPESPEGSKSDVADEDSASTSSKADGVDRPRKRHNTIVGILRSTIRGKTTEPSSPGPEVDKDGKPRSLRFTFNSNTTSSKPPDEVVQQVLEAFVKHHIQHKLVSRYLIECSGTVPNSREQVKFEVEVCKLPRLKNLHGLKFKRLAGPSAEYKDICEKILASVSL